MKLPKYQASSTTERLGVNAVAIALANMGQIWRETPVADVGIDGQIEYVSADGSATGKIVAVQIKSGTSFFKDNGASWIFYPDDKHRFYWERFPIPVLLMLHNPIENQTYWIDVRQALRIQNSKSINVPKTNILEQNGPNDLFQGYAITNQKFMSVKEVLTHLVYRKCNNPHFPVSYFSLFCTGLTNICRTLYYGMDIVMQIAENNLSSNEFGVGVGSKEQEFLFNYIKFLVHQHIVDINFSDCMIDWYDRKLQPTFMAPLTSRGKELVCDIFHLESKFNQVVEESGLYVAQEAFVEMQISSYELQRIKMMTNFENNYLKNVTVTAQSG